MAPRRRGPLDAAVSFSQPASDGGSGITSYTVTAADSTTPANGGETASGSTSPITVPGLTSGDSYTFTVTATNIVGTGPPSGHSNAVVPERSPLTVTTTSLPSGTKGHAYAATLAATGGNPPYTWKLATGSAKLPKGLKIKATGTISGKPKVSGSFSVTVEVLDQKTKKSPGHPSTQNTATKTLTITIS